MPRLPDSELNQLKQEVSLLRLVESQGYAVKKQGKDYVISCPFHDDATPSLVISPAKNLYHCFGCGAAGSVIDWVMQTQGISLPHAVQILKQDTGLINGDNSRTKHSKKTHLPALVADNSDQQTALKRVMNYYHATLKHSPEALAYLDKRGLNDAELITTFKLGFGNKTLTYRLPAAHTQAGKAVRQQLRDIGILRETGHEHFNGSLVVPITDAQSVINEVYGRKIAPNNKIAKGSPRHLYLPGTHHGVWNSQALVASEEIILCEALIDAMTFWVNGFRNVTASYGTGGFTDEHLTAFKQHNIKRVLIAYDRDEAGNRAAEKLTQLLNDKGMDAFRIVLPKGMDVNEYALQGRSSVVIGQESVATAQQVQPAQKSLGLAIRKAQWMGKACPRESGELAPTISTGRETGLASSLLAAKENNIPEVVPDTNQESEPTLILKPTQATPLPETPKLIDALVSEQQVVMVLGDRHYRIRGLNKNLSYEQLKVNVLVSSNHDSNTRAHVDSFDLYQSRPRQSFINQASSELGVQDEVIKQDLGKVLLKLETLQDQHIKNTLEPEQKDTRQLSEEEHQQAITLLKDKDLLNRILADFKMAGVVGEETNKLVGYLSCVSRKLDNPLAVIIQSSSAAGKSSLMDAILNFIPEEERVHYSAMTGQSLFYMGETNLKHKILAIAEEAGAENASYALKLLQSEGELTIASTGKDESTGNLITKAYRVEGPVMLFLTTTAIDIDEELMNRCIVLTVNESREQTQAIHAMQRQQQTLEGLLNNEDRKHLTQLHRNAQRLLRPLLVANPFAEQLTFIDDKTRTRRDHMKYLTLIRAIALLHQYQREIKTINHHGEVLEYVEVNPSDIATANRLAHDVLGRSLDELPPQTRTLLKHIYQMVSEQCQAQSIEQSHYRFSRREIRDFTGWGNTQLKHHLRRLEDMEYLIIHRGGRGQSFVYELLYDGDIEQGHRHLMGLINSEKLEKHHYNANKSGVNTELSPPSRGQVAPKSGGGRDEKNSEKPNTTVLSTHLTEKAQKKHYIGTNEKAVPSTVVV